MSRNMTNANRLLFERLIRSAPDGLRENIAHQLSRWVESSDYDKEIIKYSTVDASDLGAGCHGALVSNARLGKLWAILPGQPDLSQLDNQIRGASLVDLNAGWMTLLGSQEWFLIKEDRYQREQIVDLLGDREGAYSFEPNSSVRRFGYPRKALILPTLLATATLLLAYSPRLRHPASRTHAG